MSISSSWRRGRKPPGTGRSIGIVKPTTSTRTGQLFVHLFD